MRGVGVVRAADPGGSGPMTWALCEGWNLLSHGEMT
ncbi:unnamed protein product [Caretta caretta]